MLPRTYKRKKKTPVSQFFVLILGCAFLMFGFASKPKAILSPIQAHIEMEPDKPVIFRFSTTTKNPNELSDLIRNFLRNSADSYSVVVADMSNDFEMSIDDSKTFIAASVNKIPILAALYYKVQLGEVDLDKKITLQARDIQDYGTGSIRYNNPGTVYSVRTLAKLMIEQSDNTAAFIIANHVLTLSSIQDLMNDWGLKQTDMNKNTTSNRDMKILFKKLYDGKIANTQLNEEMFSFLGNTIYNSRLPAKLPESLTVYHKIGTEVGQIHDVGIVKTGNKTYYIGVFTEDLSEGEETDALIAEISRLVYEYMKK